ncbi:MAG: YncE family protein [Acidobacteria bacterium]|nr:YncE family protein [Acidobacteriota bacterium]
MQKIQFLVVFACLALSLQAQSGYKVVARYPVPGNGGFDYITLDPASRRLYLSHGTQVDVIDADTGSLAGTIANTPGVHGVALAPPFKHGFSSNGAEHKVLMFDPATLKELKRIDVGRGPDGIYYDPGSKRIFSNNHGSHDVTAIDAEKGEVVGTVAVKGDGEQAILTDGVIYLNSEDTNEVVIFNPKTLLVTKRLPIGLAKVPTGLAYDAKHKRLFIATRDTPKMIVMDAKSGKEITSFPIGKGADWAHFDPIAKLIFVSTGEGILNVFRQISADKYEDAGAVMTQPSAKTMAFDAKTKKIFLPSAEYEMTPAADPTKPARRTIKPGTFAVLVVDKAAGK